MIDKNYKPKISKKNEFFANKIRDLSKKYSIIGIIDVESLPASQFQRIRSSIKKDAEVLILKKNIIELVLKELEKNNKGIKELISRLSGVVGLIFTNSNPFLLFKTVKKNKSTAPAKAGQIALGNIVVPAGPTNFAPGPIIGELGALKIKAGITSGKVEIKEDTIVAKEGDEISKNLAGILTRLGIEPMEVGLNIKAIYEKGIIFLRSVLDIDEKEILNNLKQEALNSFLLSIGLNYYTKQNKDFFISTCARNSFNLALKLNYITQSTLSPLILKAYSQMNNLASNLPKELITGNIAQTSATENVVTLENSPSVNEEENKQIKKEPDINLSDLF